MNEQLLNPSSIVIVGASNDTSKPGGKVLHNIIANGYTGELYAVNPKESKVQGVDCYSDCESLPATDLAIIAVAARYVIPVLETLIRKNCKAFILFSAGFSETGLDGAALEKQCADIVDKAGGVLIGPNCIGVITGRYKGVFAGPIPKYDPNGCDCVSASGATMVYLLEMAIPRGLKFRDLFSIGNGAQIGVEDVLEYWDNTFDETKSRIKLLYMEQVSDPARFLKHARSLVKKGCRIAAIKAGSTEAGGRAVSSHTGALAGNNSAVSALFRKAGIIRCYSRVELVYVAAIFSIKQLTGDRLAVITHAGGPGVMLTDILVKGGIKVPMLKGPKSDALLAKLHSGSSVSNPIDFLATGNAQQLGEILDYVEEEDEVDGAVVVFGTTGMWSVDDVYMVLHDKIRTCKKPIFPILPSAIQAAEEVSHFQSMGHVNFTDEVTFGYVLSRVQKMNLPYDEPVMPQVETAAITKIFEGTESGYLPADKVFQLFEAAGIAHVQQSVVTCEEDAAAGSAELHFPLVMKSTAHLHKSDAGGVVLGVADVQEVRDVFSRLRKLNGSGKVIMQQQLKGTEIFLGAKLEGKFGHLLICGLGGIFVEVFRDVSTALVPVGREEATAMIRHLKCYPVIQGTRGRAGVNEEMLVDTIMHLSALLVAAPEIKELDINPLIGTPDSLVAVDGRVYF